jgi:multiple sugar transport system permease protein
MSIQGQVGSARGVAKPGLPKGGRVLTAAKREARWGWFFISPWIIGFLGFTLIPTLATLIFSFTDMKLEMFNVNFVGLQNYRTMIGDSQVWSSLLVTLNYGLYALPVAIFAPMFLAILMNQKQLFGKSFFRTGFYFPYIIPFVAAIFIWGAMLNPEGGWVNLFLERIGINDPPEWLRSPTWVYPALVIVGIWGIGNAMLLNLAALQGVPTDLYDAAKIDGAGPFRTFVNVTFPMISPVVFYNLVLTVVGLFQYFLVPLVLNQGTGQPAGKTMFYNLYLYKTFFTYQNMAYGATLAWFLFLVILAVTGLIWFTQKYWVFYSGERR